MITEEQVRAQLGNCLLEARFPQWEDCFSRGKVRDMYRVGRKRILITTDRQSAFDHLVGAVPFKGQVLNGIAHWWFQQTQDIVRNHALAMLHPNVMLAQEVKIIPLEIVMRRHIAGSTSTSMWTHYSQGERWFCGLRLPDGLRKNQQLPFENPVFTPSTKDKERDVSISPQEAIRRGLVDRDLWFEIRHVAMALFRRAEELAAKAGFILFDTKLEMGRDRQGRLIVADEMFTPDSSRFAEAASYRERFECGEEPQFLDKEPVRVWLKEHGFTDQNPIQLGDDIRVEAALKWINLYERITGQEFVPAASDIPIRQEIEQNIAPFMPKAA